MLKGFKGIIILSIVAIVIGSLSAYIFFAIRSTPPLKLISSPIVQNKMQDLFGEQKDELSHVLPHLLGLQGPRNYLFLFQNNTEIRPGGGFIGTYAVVHIENGKFEVLRIEGSEILDKQTPDIWKPEPPKVLKEHLGVDRWYFRDSNWSPDFAVSAQKAMELYKGEGGLNAEHIDTVVAFTPTVLERLLKITGPVLVEGITFTSENVTEKLEYEVEYDYEDNGRTFEQRKGIVKTFMESLLHEIKKSVFFHSAEYVQLFENLTKEKHILMYSSNSDIQKSLMQLGWDGQVASYPGDFVMWVDTNLAALKTDHALKKNLVYTIEPQGDGFLAHVSMTYTHTGTFDWRTSRYRSYARVYVPSGAKLVGSKGAMKWDRTAGVGPVDEGEDLGHHWMGAFIAVEPGKIGALELSYTLPKNIVEQIHAGKYSLRVQKQLGVPETGLQLNLNFGKNISSAIPPEEKVNWGNPSYTLLSDLTLDRNFEIGL